MAYFNHDEEQDYQELPEDGEPYMDDEDPGDWDDDRWDDELDEESKEEFL